MDKDSIMKLLARYANGMELSDLEEANLTINLKNTTFNNSDMPLAIEAFNKGSIPTKFKLVDRVDVYDDKMGFSTSYILKVIKEIPDRAKTKANVLEVLHTIERGHLIDLNGLKINSGVSIFNDVERFEGLKEAITEFNNHSKRIEAALFNELVSGVSVPNYLITLCRKDTVGRIIEGGFAKLKREVKHLELMDKIKVGDIYTHFKNPNEQVTVTGFCVIEATDELGVLYSSNGSVTICRPIVSFLESINGVPRFKKGS